MEAPCTGEWSTCTAHPNQAEYRIYTVRREKINIYFWGATFQPCLHENNTLKFVLHWTLCKFKGALFWFSGALLGISGAISPWAPVYFFHWPYGNCRIFSIEGGRLSEEEEEEEDVTLHWQCNDEWCRIDDVECWCDDNDDRWCWCKDKDDDVR